MGKTNINIGCGGAILILVGLLIVGWAINHAATNMDGLTSFIVGTIIVVLFALLLISNSRK
jgi:hypothetical protein